MLIYQSLLLGMTSALAVVAAKHGFGNPYVIAGLAGAAVVAERGRVRLGDSTEVSISLLPTVFAVAVFGPLAAMIVAVASLVADFPMLLPRARRRGGDVRGAPYLKWGIYT